ncbi:MAG: LysM peptidoglycan-binding domain-containing protein [Granulosicoccus sp.]
MNKKNKTSSNLLAAIGMLTLMLQGCASGPFGNTKSAQTSDTLPPDIQYTVEKGDRLASISLAITGDMSHWQDIANYNDIVDPRKLRVGTVLFIPASLISTEDAQTLNAELDRQQSDKSQSIEAASRPVTRVSLPASNALAVVQSSADADETQADVVLQPVVINRSFELNPIDKSELALSEQSDLAPPQVKVIGSYYPKGIYTQPASYSTLIMRVAPGTIFELEREVNDWYKVVTTQGIGYLRTVDGIIVDEN